MFDVTVACPSVQKIPGTQKIPGFKDPSLPAKEYQFPKKIRPPDVEQQLAEYPFLLDIAEEHQKRF